MAAGQPAVKRRYRSPLREAHARATRRAVVRAAIGLFAARGYVATSFDAIAAAAGVGRATVFAHFPTKAALVKAAYDVSLVGDDEPIALRDRPESLAVRAEPDPRRFLHGYAAISAGVSRGVAAMYEAIRGAAAADREAAEVWREVVDERMRGARSVVAMTADRTALRSGLDPDRAADAVWVLIDPGLYRLLVIERGWSHDAFREWLATALQRELLDGEATGRA